MSDSDDNNFPGGSKSRVNRAGESVRNGNASLEDMEVIEQWRAAHRPVLNTFQAILRMRTRGKGIIVAQRHKRKSTIFDKLLREPKMQLARMDDVAGCRLIFPDETALREFRKSLHKAHFHHARKNSIEKYDYIKKPKNTGYRGIHDVYSYDVNSVAGRRLKGLLIEVQYRTAIQHAWATAVEVIGFITTSQPKFRKGDVHYQYAMALASEILARAFEKRVGPYPDMTNEKLVNEFQAINKKLKLLFLLHGLNASHRIASDRKNIILMFTEKSSLEIKTFRTAPEALRELFYLESKFPGADIVLVKADSSEDVRIAFKNYFSDAQEFVRLVNEGCKMLSPDRFE